MAFTTSGVQYSCLGTTLGIEFVINTETPTLAQIDAAMTAFFDELDNQGGGVTSVSRTVHGDDNTGTFWTP